MSDDFDTAIAHEDFGAEAFGGLFDSVLKAAGLKKQVAKVTGLPEATLQVANPTVGQIASGVAKSGLMLASVVVPGLAAGGQIAATVKPIAATAAPLASAARSVASTVKPVAALAGPIAKEGVALSTAVTADKLIARVQQGGTIGKQAQAVIDGTAKLANAGNADAQAAKKIIGDVAADRILKGVPVGVEQKVSAAAQLAHDTVPIVLPLAAPSVVAKAGSASKVTPAPTASPPSVASASPSGPRKSGGTMLSSVPIAALATVTRATPAPSPSPAADAVAAVAGAPRWLVTDDARVFAAMGQPVSASGWLVFDDGRVVHQ